jgi:integrase
MDSTMTNPTAADNLPAGNGVSSGKSAKDMARTRYQRGSLSPLRCDKHGQKYWLGIWRLNEYVINDLGKKVRPQRVKRFYQKDYATKPLASRAFQEHLAFLGINNPGQKERELISFRQLTEKYERMILSTLAESSQAKDKSRIKVHLLPALGDLKVTEIGTETLQELVSKMKVSPKMVRNVVNVLSQVLAAGKTWGYLSSNPAEGLRLPAIEQKQAYGFPAETGRRIISAAPEPDKTIFWIFGETGIRAGELCGLDASDFNFQIGAMKVQRSAYRGKLKATKSNRPREFALSAALCAHLRQYLNGRTSGLLFEKDGKPLSADSLRKTRLKPLLKKLEIELPEGVRCGFHAFRHMNATLQDSESIPMRVRMERLGHNDGRLTMNVYTHATQDGHRKAAETIGAAIAPLVVQ